MAGAGRNKADGGFGRRGRNENRSSGEKDRRYGQKRERSGRENRSSGFGGRDESGKPGAPHGGRAGRSRAEYRNGSRTDYQSGRRAEYRDDSRSEQKSDRYREWDKNTPETEELNDENRLEGRNPVLEAFRSGRAVDKVFLQSGLQDGMILTIAREARKAGCIISYVPKERLNQMSETGHHQGVIAYAASYAYADVQDILQKAREKGEDPFIFLLDGIEDPHNLGAIIRTANLAGAHGVIITKHRSAMLTATVARASAGALNYTPVAKVTNLAAAMEELKKQGIWFVCADMNGPSMYSQNLTGPIGLVIGNEGEGVSRLIREKCDFTASIPMHGDIDSLNASVAAGVLAYEIVRQREQK